MEGDLEQEPGYTDAYCFLWFPVLTPWPYASCWRSGRGGAKDELAARGTGCLYVHLCVSNGAGNVDSMYKHKYQQRRYGALSVPQVWFLTLHFPLFLCVYINSAESCGGGTMASNIPTLLLRALVCLLHSFTHSSLSLCPLLDRKKPLLQPFTGGGVWLCVLKTPEWNQSSWTQPAPLFPLSSLLCLVSEAAKLKEKEEKEEMHSFSPSRCLSVCTRGELWLIFNDWLKKKKKKRGLGLFPASRSLTQAQSLTATHTLL